MRKEDLKEHLKKRDFKEDKHAERQVDLLLGKLNMIADTPRGHNVFSQLEIKWNKDKPIESLQSFIERLGHQTPEKRWRFVKAVVGKGFERAFWCIYDELRVKVPMDIVRTATDEPNKPLIRTAGIAPEASVEEKPKQKKKASKKTSKKA